MPEPIEPIGRGRPTAPVWPVVSRREREDERDQVDDERRRRDDAPRRRRAGESEDGGVDVLA